MSWFRCESSLRSSPKVARLARALGVSTAHARGLLTGLWCWVCESRPSGDLTGLDAVDLAFAAEWDGDAAAFERALIEARLIDVGESGRRDVHDWSERAEGWKRAENERKRRSGARKPAETVHHESSRVTHDVARVPKRDPDQTRPDQTERREEEDSSELPPPASASEPPESHEPLELEIEPVEEQPDLLPPEPAPDEPVALTFPTAGKVREWALRESHLARLVELWPGLDVPDELRKALAWCEANKAKRKTAGGMPAFLNAWLGRAQNSASPHLRAPARRDVAADTYALADRMEAERREREGEVRTEYRMRPKVSGYAVQAARGSAPS